jgi:hypothetical protein
MRKNLIAMSVAAFVGGLGMAGSATAGVWADNGVATTTPTNATIERVRGSGTGHQLIVPYFNTQVGNATLFNIVNTDVTNGKAVKIRFRGASNSDDVFDFQLFLSPGDMWTANISKGPTGVTVLTTTDKSCTLPAGVGSGSGSTFVTARLPSTLTGDALAAETREGYIEVFNMADIPPKAIDVAPATLGAVLAGANPLFTAIKHVAGVPPCTAATMNTLATDPINVTGAYTLGFRAPSATLFANWTIVNVPKSGSATGEALAITASAGVPAVPALANIVFFPQTGAAAPTINFFTADPSMRTIAGAAIGDVQNGAGAAYAGGPTPIITASMFDLPDLSTPYLLLGAYPPIYTDPVNFANNLQQSLATASITNEFLTDTTINAFTDWVFSQPTRRYAMAPDYRPLSASPPTALGRAFVTNLFYSLASTAVSGYQICAKTDGVTYWDREEFTAIGNSFVISPNPPAPAFSLCGEDSVLTFNSAGPSVLGASVARTNFPTPSSSGTVRDGWATVGTSGASGFGLPIVGKSFSAAATGTFNVGGSWEHRYVPTFP